MPTNAQLVLHLVGDGFGTPVDISTARVRETAVSDPLGNLDVPYLDKKNTFTSKDSGNHKFKPLFDCDSSKMLVITTWIANGAGGNGDWTRINHTSNFTVVSLQRRQSDGLRIGAERDSSAFTVSADAQSSGFLGANGSGIATWWCAAVTANATELWGWNADEGWLNDRDDTSADPVDMSLLDRSTLRDIEPDLFSSAWYANYKIWLFDAATIPDGLGYQLFAEEMRENRRRPRILQLQGTATPAPTSYTLTVDAGAYTLTGQDASLVRALVLSTDAGAFALTGQSVDLLKGITMPADAGSFTHTGQDVDLLKDSVLSADAGSYTESGQDVNLLKAYRLTNDPASYTLTGQQVNLIRNYLAQVDAGAYTLTGQDVTLDYSETNSFTLEAEAGSFSLSGQDVQLLRSVLMSAEAGNFTVTGQDVNFVLGFLLTIAPGSFNLTGQDVTLSLSRLLSAAAGSFTMSGRNVSLTYSGAETHEFIVIDNPKLAKPKTNATKMTQPSFSNPFIRVQ